jgi:hypothetical protein
MGHGNIIPFAGLFDVGDDLVDHELVIVFEAERMFDGESAADIDGIQFGADLFQLAVEVDHLIELTPVIDVVLDPFIEEDMEHFQLKAVFVALDLIDIEFQHLPGPETETGSIERKGRLFFCRHPDTQLEGHLHRPLILLELILVVQDGDDVFESAVEQGGDPAGIALLFEPVADDEGIFGDLLPLVQLFNDFDVIGKRGLQMDIVLQRLFDNEGKMRAFRTIAVEIFAFVVMLFDGGSEHLLGLIDLAPDLGQIRQLHRSAVLVDQGFQIDSIELKIVVFDFETFLREIKGLRHQVGVCVILRLVQVNQY